MPPRNMRAVWGQEGDICGCCGTDCIPRYQHDFDGGYRPARNTQVGGNWYSKLAIQPGEYCFANNLNYWQGNVIKYVTRYKDKNGAEDLRKAIHCIELLLEQEYGRGNPETS